MMSQNRIILHLFVSLLMAAAACNSALATQVPVVPSPSLEDLVDDPLDPSDDADAFLVSNSGRFRVENFVFNAVPSGADFVPSAEDIFVTLTETANTVMLLFQIVGDNLAAGPEAFELQVGYDVSTTNPLDVLTGHTLFMNGTGLGDGTVVINEAILGQNNALVGDLTTFSNLTNQGTRVVDTTQFASQQRSVSVDKDISLDGGTQNGRGVAFLSHFKQTFDVVRIPEPSGITLLTLGGLALGIVAGIKRRG